MTKRKKKKIGRWCNDDDDNDDNDYDDYDDDDKDDDEQLNLSLLLPQKQAIKN